jgi:hypothetical protein
LSTPCHEFVYFLSASTIGAAAIERFGLALIESNQQWLLKRAFQKDQRWIMSPSLVVREK